MTELHRLKSLSL